MTEVVPDFEWYSGISRGLNLPPRCPFATVHRCPRYYGSLSLLKHTGATAIDKDLDDSLFARWKKSPLWPVISEQEAWVAGPDGGRTSVANFCPEVAYDRFGYFASHLAPYADTIDLEFAHKSLAGRGVPSNDTRWEWAAARPMHYSECPLYSVLHHTSQADAVLAETEDLLEVKPGAFGIALNVKALITRFCRWWLTRIATQTRGRDA